MAKAFEPDKASCGGFLNSSVRGARAPIEGEFRQLFVGGEAAQQGKPTAGRDWAFLAMRREDLGVPKQSS
jgi:hypothetical protein